MMTDKELLELAGKAADIPPRVIGAARGIYNCDERGWHSNWNPLKNDADALRLAVKLRIDIYLSDSMVEAMSDSSPIMGETMDGALDAHAATRRAIVRAAAAIGEQLP